MTVFQSALTLLIYFLDATAPSQCYCTVFPVSRFFHDSRFSSRELAFVVQIREHCAPVSAGTRSTVNHGFPDLLEMGIISRFSYSRFRFKIEIEDRKT